MKSSTTMKLGPGTLEFLKKCFLNDVPGFPNRSWKELKTYFTVLNSGNNVSMGVGPIVSYKELVSGWLSTFNGTEEMESIVVDLFDPNVIRNLDGNVEEIYREANLKLLRDGFRIEAGTICTVHKVDHKAEKEQDEKLKAKLNEISNSLAELEACLNRLKKDIASLGQQ